MAALAYRISDLGAEGALVVSPLGLQAGAEKIAAAEKIISVRLTPDSTSTDYLMEFLNKAMAGISLRVGAAMTASCHVYRNCRTCGQQFEAVSDGEYYCEDCKAAR